MSPSTPARGARSAPVHWTDLSDEELLEVRICDLRLKIEGSELAPRVAQLYHELEERGLAIRPHCYLSDEWQSPDGQIAIGIPFYLAHPRLKALEFRMMFEVEGGTPSSCMRLLRHEAGHALDHAFRLHRRKDWQRVFGSPRRPYNPYFYLVDPHSKHHVRNLPEDYAQSHPVEDFAETFAVWLNPHSHWRTRYAGWPAMRKLRYVDRLMRELAGRPAPRRKLVLERDARRLRSTLKSYYERKFRLYQLGDLSFTVPELKKIFRVSHGRPSDRSAARLVRRHKRLILDAVCGWSGAREHHVESVVTRLARFCEEHGLSVRDSEEAALVRFSTYVATLILNRMHTHSYRLIRR